MARSNSPAFDEDFRNEAQNVINNRQKDKDAKKRKKEKGESMGPDSLIYADSPEGRALAATLEPSPEPQTSAPFEYEPGKSYFVDSPEGRALAATFEPIPTPGQPKKPADDPDPFDEGAFLKAKMDLAEEARMLLNTRSAKGYEDDLADLRERGKDLGINDDRFNRFLKRENLKRPSIDPEAQKYSERALDAEDKGFGGLAELYRLQSDAKLGQPSEERRSRSLAGTGEAVKSEMNADTPPSRLLREAKSLRRRGYLGAANAIEAVATKKLVEQTGNRDYESAYEKEKMGLLEADALRQDARVRGLKQDQIDALMDELEKMRPEERDKYLSDNYGDAE